MYDGKQTQSLTTPDGLSFGSQITWQTGVIPEAGRNGLLMEEVLEAIIERMAYLQETLPCRENALIITHIEEALNWCNRRQQLRARQGVRGTLQSHVSANQRVA